MRDEPTTHLCSSCIHRRVCYIRRDAEGATAIFTQTFQRLEELRAEASASYNIPKCGEYEEVSDG